MLSGHLEQIGIGVLEGGIEGAEMFATGCRKPVALSAEDVIETKIGVSAAGELPRWRAC